MTSVPPLHAWLLQTKERVNTSFILVWLVAALTVGTVGSFIYAERKQHELVAITEDAREMRRARQALMEVDAAVVHGLAELTQKGATSEDYFRAKERLAKHGPDHFPLNTYRNGQALDTSELVAQLKSAWSDTWTLIQRADFDGAKQTYLQHVVAPVLADIVASMYARIADFESSYTAVNNSIAIMTSTVLALQIVTGFICAYAFRRAARGIQRESNARAQAVMSADSSREQVMRLFDMADMLQSATDFGDANAVLTATAIDLMPGFGGALYVFNNSRDRLVLSASWSSSPNSLWDAAIPESVTLSQCWALKRGKPHVNRPHSHKLCCEHHSSDYHVLELPMTARGEILGMLQIFARGDDAETRLQIVRGIGAAIADGMSLALSSIQLREQLRSQALRDPLTGLYNRRYMEDTMERFVRLAEREKREFSVIMIDLDHFKRLNDQFGHAKGDAVLRDCGAGLIGKLRATDVACRYGGEELIVLLPDCDLDMACVKAESIRDFVAGLSEPNGASVSASLGVAAFAEHSTTAREILADADAALYEAKQNGRNRVVRASSRYASQNRPQQRDADSSVPVLIAAE